MLGRLWRSAGARTEPGRSTGGPKCWPVPSSSIMAPNSGHQPGATTRGSKRRRKPIEIEDIYPEKFLSEAHIHATALLSLLKAECTPGRYIKKKQLERMYAEFCVHEGWQPRNWVAIGRQLGKMTEKRTTRRNGEKFVAYRIPRP